MGRSRLGRVVSVIAAVGVVGVLPGVTAQPAAAAPMSGAQIAALDVAPATVVRTDVVTGGNGVAVGAAPIAGFPTQGGSYLILSTGDASQTVGTADQFVSVDNGGAPAGVDGHDLTKATLTLRPPAGAKCVSFDFAFLSEEYPEYVGSQFNDVFTAEQNVSEWSLLGSTMVAPNNFAYDTSGNIISINTVFGMAPTGGTTMDGSTPPLAAKSPLEPKLDGPDAGTVDVILSVQDLGDNIYDSVVLLDNVRYLFGGDCDRGAEDLTDTDGDELPDTWETDGIDYDGDGTPELDLPAMGADPEHKDLFLETDWMQKPGPCVWIICLPGPTFAPDRGALDDVVSAFDSAPVPNPDGATGIRVHIDSGPTAEMDPVTHAPWGGMSKANVVPYDADLGTMAAGVYNWTEFDAIRGDHFDTFRRDVFHYVVYGDDYGSTQSSGISRGIPGGDLIVTDGAFNGGAGFTRTQERGTFMHELGHNLGLMHGGGDHTNYKPNYLSIMSYSFQLIGLMPGSTLDYSRGALNGLNENALSEGAGLDPDATVAGHGTRYSCGSTGAASAATNVDWNCSGAIDPGTVSVSVNGDAAKGMLAGFDDWPAVKFFGGSIGDLGESAPPPTETPDSDEFDPAEALASHVLGAAGDGTVELVGPTALLPGTGDENLLVDVTNAGEVPATYTVDLAPDGLSVADTSLDVTVAGGATERVRFAVADPRAPGTYDVAVTLSSSLGGADLDWSALAVVVPDMAAPGAADDAAEALDQIDSLPPDEVDPEVVDELAGMVSTFVELRGEYHAVVPARILDTRKAVGAPDAPLGPSATLTLDVTGVGGVPADGVDAVVMNVTAVGGTEASHLTAWPSGGGRPTASNLNFSAGQTVPNLVVVKVGAGGAVNLFNNSGSTDVLADVVGWYDVAGGSQFTPVVPARLLDTRKALGAPDAPLGAGATLDLDVTGAGGVPAVDVSAVILNVTAVGPTASSHLTVWPKGAAKPTASNLNFVAGQTVPNLVVVKVGAGGMVSLFNNSGEVDVLADVVGWYDTGGDVHSEYTSLPPVRILDTRKALGGPGTKVGAGETRALDVTGTGGVPSDGVGAVVLNVTVTNPSESSHLTLWPSNASRPSASNLNYGAGLTVANLVVVGVAPDGTISYRNNSGSTDVIADVVGWFDTP